MSDNLHAIRSFTGDDHPEAVATLVAAFDRDPLGYWLFPNDSVRHSNHTALFNEVLRAPKPGAVIDVTDTVDAVAIWYPPNTAQEWGAPPNANPQAAELFERIGQSCPPQPFWYLAFLGAHSSGTGAGSAILRHRLAQMDGQVALWTGNEKNLAFYARLGFEQKSKCTVDGAKAWWMTRARLSITQISASVMS